LTNDTLIKSGAGLVYWMTISGLDAMSIELNDSIANDGEDKWGVDIPENSPPGHPIFDPPLEFEYGIYLDISVATGKVVVGYK